MSGLYYKNILTTVSDNRKLHLYYTIIVSLAQALALASVVSYDHK